MNKEENPVVEKDKSIEEEKPVIEQDKPIEEKTYYDTNKEVEQDIKKNEKVLQEKIEHIMSDLDEIDKHDLQKKKRRTIIFTLVVILEIFIIGYIVLGRRTTEEKYKTVLKCRSSEDEIYENYAVRMTNVYYLDNNNKVAKTENEILYAYNDKATYDFNTRDVSNKKINFLGYDEQSVVNDTSYIYKKVTTYDYAKLKKNKKVKFNKDTITFTLPGSDEETTIMIETYDDVLNTNEMMGFTCE